MKNETRFVRISNLANWKHRIKTDVLDPTDKIKLDESALTLEIEAEGIDYVKLKKAVKAEIDGKADKLRRDAETLLEYLGA